MAAGSLEVVPLMSEASFNFQGDFAAKDLRLMASFVSFQRMAAIVSPLTVPVKVKVVPGENGLPPVRKNAFP